MRLTITAAVLLLSAALGCTADRATGPEVHGVQSRAGRGGPTIDRPFQGDCVLEGRNSGNVNTITGTCVLAHLGRSSVRFVETVNFATGAYEGDAVFIAANGDELRVRLAGVATPRFDGGNFVGVNQLGTAVIVGGTGRFENATGVAAHTGVVTFRSPTLGAATYHLEGRLAY